MECQVCHQEILHHACQTASRHYDEGLVDAFYGKNNIIACLGCVMKARSGNQPPTSGPAPTPVVTVPVVQDPVADAKEALVRVPQALLRVCLRDCLTVCLTD